MVTSAAIIDSIDRPYKKLWLKPTFSITMRFVPHEIWPTFGERNLILVVNEAFNELINVVDLPTLCRITTKFLDPFFEIPSFMRGRLCAPSIEA